MLFSTKMFYGIRSVLISILGFLICIVNPDIWDSVFSNKEYKYPYENKIVEIECADMNNQDLFVNLDDSHWTTWLNYLCNNDEVTEEKLKEYVSWYADTNVTDLLFCTFCQSSNTPTDVMTFRGDMYPNTLQNGKPVDYSAWKWNHDIYKEYGIDLFELWFDECREQGIRPWMSLRMNDNHLPYDETSFLRGDLFYLAKENGWMIGEKYGYYQICLDYSYPEVRQYMLDYIREQIMKYDVYGLELDWMREIFCFDYQSADTAEINGIMNGFMRSVNEIIKEAEEKWGHEIKLSARLNRDIDQAYIFGFDARTWAKEKLVDSVTITPRWSTCDSGMPIAEWKKELEGIEIYAGIETLVNKQGDAYSADVATVCGYASQYMTAGADAIYLFNYMKTSPTNSRSDALFNLLGNTEEVYNSSRRHVVTWQDITPYGCEPYQPLDKVILFRQPYSVDVETGFVPDGRTIKLILGFDKEIDGEKLSVTVNGKECLFAGGLAKNNMESVYTDENTFTYVFSVESSAVKNNIQTVQVTSETLHPVTIKYCEMDII